MLAEPGSFEQRQREPALLVRHTTQRDAALVEYAQGLGDARINTTALEQALLIKITKQRSRGHLQRMRGRRAATLGQYPLHECIDASPDHRRDTLLRQWPTAQDDQHHVGGRAKIRRRVDEGAVQVERDGLDAINQLRHGSSAIVEKSELATRPPPCSAASSGAPAIPCVARSTAK